MAWHGTMDLPGANHLAAYFHRGKKGEGRGEIDERVWMDRRRDSTIFLTGVARLGRRRLQIKGIIWVSAGSSQI